MKLSLFILFPFLLFSINCDDLLSKMSLDEKIGQLFMIPLCPKRDDYHMQDVKKLICKYHIGGIIVKQSDPETQINCLNDLQKISKLPLIVAADAEWGLGMRMEKTISYPKNIYLSNIEDESLLYELGCEIARQLKLVGVHINLAPVVDIDTSDNDFLSERSFGKDPSLVAKKAKVLVLGMQSQNILATLKHFPGYNAVEIDPHLNLPKTSHIKNRLENFDFIPYKELIEDVAFIMTAHILLYNISNIPASMSKEIITELLIDTLGFQGIIITDALNMKALTNLYSIEDIALYAHIAGNDILLYGDHINPNVDDIIARQIPLAFFAIKQAYLKNILDEKKLDRQVLKILKAKEKLNLFENRFIDEFDEKKLNSQNAYLLKEKLEKESLK